MNYLLIAQLLLVGFFSVVSFFFSAAEMALVSLSRPRLKKLIAQRRELASAFLEWLSTPQYLFTTILIGNTLVNVFATVLATNVAVWLFYGLNPSLAETGAWLLMVFLLFFFSELIPKIVARHRPERVAILTLGWLSALTKFSTPFIRAGLRLFEGLFPSLEASPVGRVSVYSIEDLREVIASTAKQGLLPARSTDMMERVLNLNRITVSKIMTPFEKLSALDARLDIDIVLDQMAEMGHSRVPVYRGNERKIEGYLHIKDVLMAWRGALPLKTDQLIRQPLFIGPDYMIGELLESFRKGESHLAVIKNSHGECMGILTLEDILEEIVGEILDEREFDASRRSR
jgi:CBS domain containing-hemolysin-like protein